MMFTKKEIHIGSLIRETIKRKNVSIVDFAKAINCSRPNVYSIFKRKDIDTSLLKTISDVLEFDFLKLYSNKEKDNKKSCIVILKTEENKLKELLSDEAISIVKILPT